MRSIAGIINLDQEAPSLNLLPNLQAMAVSMAKTSNEWQQNPPLSIMPTWDEADGLGIVDLTQENCQPRQNDDGKLLLAFDGQLDNAASLCEMLIAKGYTLPTQDDHAIIIAAYQHWQLDFLQHLRGAFALGLWDARQRRLLLARDRLGIKPLYYSYACGHLFFASQLTAILATDLVPRELDLAGVDSFLAYGSVQEPLTLIKNTRSLPAASYLRSDQQYHGATTCYWQPNYEPITKTMPEQVALISDSLRQSAVTAAKVDDKAGIFLSGGLDSAALLQILRQDSNLDLHACTVIFPGQNPQEQTGAANAAAKHQVQHTMTVFPLEELKQQLTTFLSLIDVPSIDGLNTWLATGMAKQAGLKTAFSGVGGDELFAGYHGFHQARRLLRLQKMLHRHPLLRYLCRATGSLKNNEAIQKLATLTTWKYSGYFLNRQIFSANTRKSLLGNASSSLIGDWPATVFHALNQKAHLWKNDDINHISYLEINTYLRSTLLRNTANCSHKSGIDIRMPFLDQQLVELMLRIPGHHKISDQYQKPLLQQAAALELQLAKQPKQEFSMPMELLIKGPWRNMVENTILTPNMLLNQKAVNQIWRRFQQQKLPWGRIWTLFVLLHWLKQHQMI